MEAFLIYQAKVAVALLVFYLFYRFLLKKETFHRLNRAVLVGAAVLSFLLPLCIITIHKPMPVSPALAPAVAGLGLVEAQLAPEVVGEAVSSAPWWPVALAALFFAGVAFVLGRVSVSILSVLRIIRRGQCVREEDGCRIIVTEREIDPFSWMRYIVLSRKDWEDGHGSILLHEKAHIGYGHSAELLLVDILTAFQWFNPAVWMLRADLQELHEYEADDAVLRSGANLREYQYLLIRKAVSKSGYSVANSFNHSILKNRITMMSKAKSPLLRGLRALWMLPLVCLGLCLQARTVYVPTDKDSEKIVSGERGKAFLEEIVVVKYAPADISANAIRQGKTLEELPFSAPLEADTPPVCSEKFEAWLNLRLVYPKDCLDAGAVVVRFTVTEEGKVADVQLLHSPCEELGATVTKLVAKSPSWTPALRGGKPVAVQLVQAVEFVIRAPRQAAAVPAEVRVELNLRPDGKVESGGQVLDVADVKSVLPFVEDVNLPRTVVINAPADIPMQQVDALKEELRKVNFLRVFYASPVSASGAVRHLPPVKDVEGKPIQMNSPAPEKNPKILRDNICFVRINSNDKVLFGVTPYNLTDEEKLLAAGKKFVLEHGRESVFSLRYDNGTSYGAYQKMQELLRKVYDDLRNDKALELFGKPLSAVSETELNEIYQLIPMIILEAAKQSPSAK